MNQSNSSDAQPSFEELTTQLEAVLEQLERGDLSLDAALATYERGVALVRQCNEVLDQAELKISELSVSVADQPPGRGASIQHLFRFDFDRDDEDDDEDEE